MLRTGLVYRALGFPPQFFTVMFAVPRIVGYLSHWRESLSDPDTKIMRPQEDYWVSAFHFTTLRSCPCLTRCCNGSVPHVDVSSMARLLSVLYHSFLGVPS